MRKISGIETDRKGHQFYYARLTFKEMDLSPNVYKEIRPELIKTLTRDIRQRDILEDVTAYEENGKIYLANGKHRYTAAKEHDAIPRDERDDDDKDNWMDAEVGAKVFINLPREQIPDIVMALDDVRKKAAAGERQSGLAISYEAAKTALESESPRGTVIDEMAVMKRMQHIQTRITRRGGKATIPKVASRQVIVANHIERLKKDSTIVGPMITQRQVPMTAIENHVENCIYDLITRENLSSCLQHLVRPEPVRSIEMVDGKDPREIEYQNLKKALEILADEVIVPLADTDLDQAVGLCKRHALEAVGRTMRAIFITVYRMDEVEPLAREHISDWTEFTDHIIRLKDVNWADPAFQALRSAESMYRGFPDPEVPEAVQQGIRAVVFPDAP